MSQNAKPPSTISKIGFLEKHATDPLVASAVLSAPLLEWLI